jgi:hypothetical protein
MGFTRCVLPPGSCAPVDLPAFAEAASADKPAARHARGLELIEVRTVGEALDALMDW